VSGYSKQSKEKGTGESPKAGVSPRSKGNPKSVASIGTAKQRGGRDGANLVSSSGALRLGAGEDTEKCTSEQKTIKPLQKQARRAAAAKPATARHVARFWVMRRNKQLKRQAAKTKSTNWLAGLKGRERAVPLKQLERSRRTSEALTPGDASQANALSQGAVESAEVAASEPASSGTEQDSERQRKALLTALDSVTCGGVETRVSYQEVPTQQQSSC
jgi:hypothetical protein